MDQTSKDYQVIVNGTVFSSYIDTKIRIEVGQKLSYECLDGYAFKEDGLGRNKSITITCYEDGTYIYPTSWPTCVQNTSCSSPEPPNVDLEEAQPLLLYTNDQEAMYKY